MKQSLTIPIQHKLSLLLTTLFISFPLYCADNNYVTPTPGVPCPGEPCYTLSQYAHQNFSSNTTLVFLPGTHTLNYTISVGTISNFGGNAYTYQPDYYYPHPSFALLGSPSSHPEVTSRIVCTWPAGFVFSGISELHISALAFISCGHNDSAAVNIHSVWNASISNCIFQNNTNSRSGPSNHVLYGGAIYVHNSTLSLIGNAFLKNFAFEGGALEVNANNILTLSHNIFQKNSATYSGGALNARINNTLTLLNNTFQINSAMFGGALIIYTCNTLNLSESTFQNNSAPFGGVLWANASNTLTLSEITFQSNSANNGGVLIVFGNNTLTLSKSKFQNNFATDYGGALVAYYTNNILTLLENTFQNNSAINAGGVLFLYAAAADILLSVNTFLNNSAEYGGVLYAHTNNILTLSNNNFHNNSADYDGGALVIRQSKTNLTDNTFTGNTAQSHGGAILCLSSSDFSVYGSHRLQSNDALYGGGIAALECQILFAGDLLVEYNTADYGGGLYAEQSHAFVTGYARFSKNCANRSGGGIYASRSKLYFEQCITFVENSALNGGGMLFTGDSKLYLQPNTTMRFIENFARQKGGAIEVESYDPFSRCVETSCKFLIGNDCFFQIQTTRQYDTKTNISEITELQSISIYFKNNTALEAGASLYGGSVDNCNLSFINPQLQNEFELYNCTNSGEVFDYITSSDEKSLDISSDPLYICTCEDGEPDCSVSSITRSVYPGGKIEVPIIAYGQRNGTTPALIQTIIPTDEITIGEPGQTQSIQKKCTVLKYVVHAQAPAVGTTQEITLYAKGPCPAKERISFSESPTNVVKVCICILPCPPGFELRTQLFCICAQRLVNEGFTQTCRVDDGKIERTAEFWVGYVPDNTSDGLILHPHCPFDYCKIPEKMYIAVDDSDEQCSNNRTGLLCGSCSQDFSLALGTNRCLQCSSGYLWLIVAFAFAGVALVLLHFVLRLTVAVGTINGLLFYANIFALNSATFLQPQRTNVLTVFIAWLNLDLGIETCFYNGMDAYSKTWLQFVFPLYVWALVIAIIIISHYSIRISRILSNSTIEVLATLILLSYAKLLRTCIAALNYTHLEYPNNLKIAVWLLDPNIRYLSSKHMPLFTAAVVCLVSLFLPYTVFLLFGQCLRKSGWKIFSWVNNHRVLPFLDAYHAPYTDKHRYWTGLMLLVRCILFLIFAFNTLEDPNINLLCIACSTAVLHILHTLFGNGIYKTWFLTILELSFNTNLGILAIATLYIRTSFANGNQNAVTFTSISLAFATFIGIVIYHSVQQLKEAPQWWRRVFQLERDDCDPFSPTDGEPKPEKIRQASVCDLSGAYPTVSYLNFPEIARARKLELQESVATSGNKNDAQ